MNRKWKSTILAWLLIFISLSACQSLKGLQSGTDIPAALVVTPSVSPLLMQTQAMIRETEFLGVVVPTAVLSMDDVLITETVDLVLPATPLPDPLRFVFPTSVPKPVSAWRPPLYPIPWAPTPYDHFYFARPIAADEINWPEQNYRYGGVFFEDQVHTGVDIPAAKGTPVLAVGPGKVIWAGYGVYRGGNDESDPYGLAVTIRHDFGYQGLPLYTVYGHLDEMKVVQGQHVDTGEVVGLVGQTGFVTGPHLHFEVRLDENTFFNTRNPELWLSPPQGWGILAGKILDSSYQPVTKLPIIVTSVSSGQNWFSRTYGTGATNSDPYYQENVVVGDLPAGRYNIRIDYAGVYYAQEIEIKAGNVSYFYFYGRYGFEVEMPPLPGADFIPEPVGN